MDALHVKQAEVTLIGRGAVLKLPAVSVVVGQDQSIELTSGWLDLQQAADEVVYLVPMRYKQIGAHHYLIPVGEFTGALGLRVKLTITK